MKSCEGAHPHLTMKIHEEGKGLLRKQGNYKSES